ncbi:hypothetical protein ABN584_06095 [Gloeocapsa sp. BRSZ]
MNQSIALAQIVSKYAAIGSELEVGLVDGKVCRVKATVGLIAAYDPFSNDQLPITTIQLTTQAIASLVLLNLVNYC